MLTIVTPSYNQGNYINDTIQSILAQGKASEILEYIIIDAVSTDNTHKIVKQNSILLKNKKIDFTFISEKDGGQADAINKGWARSKGEILGYLNSDDYFEPNVLNEVIKYFRENPQVNWAYGGWNIVDKNNNIYSTVLPGHYNRDKLLHYSFIGQPSVFFRKKMLSEFGFLNKKLHLAMDYDLWLRFATKYNAGIIPLVISNMRYYPEAKSGGKTLEQQLEILKIASRYSHFFSFLRLKQYFYFLRGLFVILLKIDITHRVNKS